MTKPLTEEQKAWGRFSANVQMFLKNKVERSYCFFETKEGLKGCFYKANTDFCLSIICGILKDIAIGISKDKAKEILAKIQVYGEETINNINIEEDK